MQGRLLHRRSPLQVLLEMYPLPCLQGRAREGWLFGRKVKDQKLHPLQTSPCKQGEEQIVEHRVAWRARRTRSEQNWSIRQFVRIVGAVAGEVLSQQGMRCGDAFDAALAP